MDVPSNHELIEKISIITCNRKECETKYPNKLIVTLGADVLIYHNGEEIIRMPDIKTEVVDTTGAGNTLNGNLCAFLAIGMSMHYSLEKAMYASAMKLTQKSAQAGMPYLDDLEEFRRTQHKNDFNYDEDNIDSIKESTEYSIDKNNKNSKN